MRRVSENMHSYLIGRSVRRRSRPQRNGEWERSGKAAAVRRGAVLPGAVLLGAVLSSGCGLGPRPAPPAETLDAILTTDAGCEVDDQWAIAYLLRSSGIRTRAIVTTHAPNLAPPAAESSARVARDVIARLGLAEPPPVIPGSSEPLAADGRPRRNAGVERILEAAREFSPDRRLAVIAIGAATDVASALLIDPTLAQRIEVLAMGFERWPEGGDPWNVKNDPAAYRAILDSEVPLTIGCAEVCRRHLTAGAAEASRLTEEAGALGDLLRGDFARWLESNRELARRETGRDAWVLWDLITVAHLRGFAETVSYPRPRLREDLSFAVDGARAGPFRWIVRVDGEAVWKDLRRKLRAD